MAHYLNPKILPEVRVDIITSKVLDYVDSMRGTMISDDVADKVLAQLNLFHGKHGPFERTSLWNSSRSLTPLQWWGGMIKASVPELSAFATKVLSIPATSADAERNFSSFGFIHSKSRNRLSTEKATTSTFVFCNLRLSKVRVTGCDADFEDGDD